MLSITYQASYKWDDHVILCIGDLLGIADFIASQVAGDGLKFEIYHGAEVSIGPKTGGPHGETTQLIFLSSAELLELISVCDGLSKSPPPSTGYIELSNGYKVVLVTNG